MIKRRQKESGPQRTGRQGAISRETDNKGRESAQAEAGAAQKETMLSVWPANGGDVSIGLTGKAMKVHPLCLMFSQIAPLSRQERAEIFADIKANGIKIPILINEAGDTIIDGYTRWGIAYDLGLRKSQVPIQRFTGSDEEIESEILSRNLFRRHMTDEQRAAIFMKIRGPQLQKQAKERQRAAGGDKRSTAFLENSLSSFSEGSEAYAGNKKSDSDDAKPIHVAAKLAEEMGITQHKAEQIVKAHNAGTLDDVITREQRLREAAAKAGKKTGKKKEAPFEDAVYKKWTAWLNRFAPEQGRVMKLIDDWIRSA